MYVSNDTEIPILYIVAGAEVAHGTILPGQGRDLGDGNTDSVSFSTDDGAPLPASLLIMLSKI